MRQFAPDKWLIKSALSAVKSSSLVPGVYKINWRQHATMAGIVHKHKLSASTTTTKCVDAKKRTFRQKDEKRNREKKLIHKFSTSFGTLAFSYLSPDDDTAGGSGQVTEGARTIFETQWKTAANDTNDACIRWEQFDFNEHKGSEHMLQWQARAQSERIMKLAAQTRRRTVKHPIIIIFGLYFWIFH